MREDKNTEFKREYTDDIKYSIIAFANTDGGTIYIGINDDGSIRGADNPEVTLLRITNMITSLKHIDHNDLLPLGIINCILCPSRLAVPNSDQP